MKFDFNKLYLLPLAVVVLIIGGYYLFNMQTTSAKSKISDEWQVFDVPPEESAPPVNEPPQEQTP